MERSNNSFGEAGDNFCELLNLRTQYFLPWVPKWDPAMLIFSYVLSNTNFSANTTAPNLNSTVVTLTTVSALPPLPERS